MVQVFRDELARTKVALSQAEQRYRVISENAADVIYVLDMHGRITFVSPSITRLLGFTPAERVGKTFDEFAIASGSLENVRKLLFAALNGELDQAIFEAECVHKNGDRVWTEVNARVARSDDGSVEGIHVAVRDVTKRRAATATLVESEERYRFVSENAADAVLVYDANGYCLYVSPSFERLTGFPAEAILGMNFRQLPVDPASQAAAIDAFERAIRGEVEEYTIDYHHPNVGGAAMWTEAHHRVVRDSDGSLDSIHVAHRDVTERKSLNAALDRQRDRLAARGQRLASLNERLEAFAATVSHDLQGPLRRIERLLAPTLGTEVAFDAEIVVAVRREAAEMSELVHHLLEVSRSHSRPLSRTTFDLAAMVVTVVDELRLESGRLCELSTPSESVVVRADEQLVQMVITNLIRNSFNHVPEDTQLAIRFESHEEDEIRVCSIMDNGPGYPDLDLIGSFTRGPNPSSRPGHGLGLATVKAMIERHEGRLWFEDAVGGSAQTRFTLGESLSK